MIPATFEVAVEDIGVFTFRRRNMRDQLKIEAAARHDTNSMSSSGDLFLAALQIETLSLLTVTAPDGWNLLDLDPLNESDWAKLDRVFRELRSAEERFRGRVPEQPRGVGAGAQ